MVRVSLVLLPGSNPFYLTRFKDFSTLVFDDMHFLYLVSVSQRQLFFLELTPTLTLGLGLGVP